MARAKKSKRIPNLVNPKCAVYIRVSTDKQANEGDSVEMQESLAMKAIEDINGTLHKIYIDGGVSATKKELHSRKELMKCLDDAKNGLFDILFVYKRDRLYRAMDEGVIIRGMLSKANVKLKFTNTSEIALDDESDHYEIFENLLAGIASLESKQIAKRVSDTMLNNAKNGKWTGGNLPYGYYYDEHKNICFDDESLPIINEAVDLYLSGIGCFAIARYFNGIEVNTLGLRPDGAITKKMYRTSRKSKSHWTKETIEGIIHNPMYSGYLVYRTEDETVVTRGNHPQVRSEDEQMQIENMKKEKKKKSPRAYTTSYLLTDVLVCGCCGKKINGNTRKKGSNTDYSFYKCANGRMKEHKLSDETVCYKSFRKEYLEEVIVEAIKSYMKNVNIDELKEKSANESNNRLNSLKIEVKNLENKQKQLTEQKDSLFRVVTELALNLDVPQDVKTTLMNQYNMKIVEIANEEKEISDKVFEIQKKVEDKSSNHKDLALIFDKISNFSKIYDNSSNLRKRSLILDLIEKIIINNDLSVEIFLKVEVFEYMTKGGEKTIIDNFEFFGAVANPNTPKNSKKISFSIRENKLFCSIKALIMSFNTLMTMVAEKFDYDERFKEWVDFEVHKRNFDKINDNRSLYRVTSEYLYPPKIEMLEIFLKRFGLEINEYLERIGISQDLYENIGRDKEFYSLVMKVFKEEKEKISKEIINLCEKIEHNFMVSKSKSFKVNQKHYQPYYTNSSNRRVDRICINRKVFIEAIYFFLFENDLELNFDNLLKIKIDIDRYKVEISDGENSMTFPRVILRGSRVLCHPNHLIKLYDLIVQQKPLGETSDF